MSAEILKQELSPLEALVMEVRRLRASGVPRLRQMVQTGELSRLLHAAVGREYRRRLSYDAELDARVEYVRAVVRTVRTGEPQVDATLDATVEFMMGEI